jgi:hypothetical protein
VSNSWQALSPLLRNHGYCVFALDYGAHNGSGAVGVYGVGDIAESAGQLAAFVDQVLGATGGRNCSPNSTRPGRRSPASTTP